MYPRQSLTPRCSAKPTRHPAHPDVDPHAVFKTQLALRLKKTPQAEMLPSGHGNSTTSQHHSGCSWRCAVFVRNSSCLQSREVGPVATQARKCCSGLSAGEFRPNSVPLGFEKACSGLSEGGIPSNSAHARIHLD